MIKISSPCSVGAMGYKPYYVLLTFRCSLISTLDRVKICRRINALNPEPDMFAPHRPVRRATITANILDAYQATTEKDRETILKEGVVEGGQRLGGETRFVYLRVCTGRQLIDAEPGERRPHRWEF